MELEEGLFAFANQQTEIAALLGGPAGLRFFKLVVPQRSKMPASVVQRTSTDRSETYCGSIRLVSMTLQLDHYGSSWQQAVEVAKAFRDLLLQRPGEPAKYPASLGAVVVRAATLQNEFDLDDPEPGLFRRSQSWLFWYEE